MRVRRLLVLLIFASVGLLALAWGGAANSGGAPNPPDNSKNGCAPCHGSNPSAIARVTLADVPPKYTPGQTYTLTMRIEGAPNGINNQGGFAASADGGTFAVVDDKAKIDKGAVTHTGAGNDQRSWKFSWTAPTGGDVNFFFAGNGVNGDGINDPGDQWMKGTAKSSPGTGQANNSTAPTNPPASKDGTPTLTGAATLALVALVVLVRRRRS